MLKDFVYGVKIFLRGVFSFYGDKSLWRYAALPLFCTFIACAVLFYGAYIAGSSMAVVVRDWSAGLPDYLSFLSAILGGAVFIISLLLSVVIAISALGVIYECFGGVFFDALIEKFAEKYYGKTTVIRDMKFNISFMFASLWYGVKTLLISLPLLLLAVIFPIIGKIVLITVMGYRFGICYPVAAGFCQGRSFKESMAMLASKKAVVSGFGVTAYILLMLIPFAVIFLLPGIVLGGVILFQEKCTDSDSSL